MGLLSELKPKKGSNRADKRRGRGDATGLGGTAGKGHKGQKARSGGHVKRGFEGGQMPIQRRFPKFGFKAPFRKDYSAVNLKDLERFSGEVTPEILRSVGLAKPGLVKILGVGSLKKGLTVKAHAFSEKAKAGIEAAGGKVEVIK